MATKMPKKTRRDVAEIARSIGERAIGENLTPRDDRVHEAPKEDTRNQAAVELGRLGGKKGGPQRARNLTKEKRIENCEEGGTCKMV